MPETENLHHDNPEARSQNPQADDQQTSWDAFQSPVVNSEQTEDELLRHERQVGAKLLSSVNFEKRHQDIVDSSFHRAEHLPDGSGAERRNYAYVARLEDLVAKRGNEFEKRIWQESTRHLIIKPEDITDAYWHSQEELVRDQTGDRITIGEREKATLSREIQSEQGESLKSWSDYLGNENSTYPMWFKVYAWDGMSKMSSVFDAEKQQFKKRDIHTVSPYPKLNPAALAKVYDAVTDFYGINGAQNSENNRDSQLNSLISSGNFPKLYAKMLLDSKITVKTPERAQDVSGEWVEYLLGDEERLAEAAEGTPWCIVSPSVGRSYLTTGEYGEVHEDYENSGNNEENRAKFLLFHLHDPVTGQLSSSACASIRLNTWGQVAEISGLADGSAQRVEDALLPTVEEKVKTLPGGEKYLQAFADTKYLTKLTHKFEDDEPFSAEELDFIYETKREIAALNTYGEDPRVEELQYEIEKMLENGTDANSIVKVAGSGLIADNLDIFFEHGANVDLMVENISTFAFDHELVNNLLEHGADADRLLGKLSLGAIIENLDALTAHGVDLDVNKLPLRRLNPEIISRNLDVLLSHGAKPELILQKLHEPSPVYRDGTSEWDHMSDEMRARIQSALGQTEA